MYSSLKKLDPAKELKSLDDAITDFKEQGGEAETKKTDTDGEQDTEETPKGDNEETLKRAKEQLTTHQDEVLKPFKDDLENLKNEDSPDEKKVKDLELQVKKAELQELKLKITVATLEKNEEEKNKLTNQAIDLTDEIQAAETKASEPEESEEVKNIKKDIEEQKSKIDGIKKAAKDSKSPLANPDVLKKALGQEEEKLKDLEKQLEKAKGGESSEVAKKESNQTKIAPKYMKFEEFMAMKNQK
jgi:hypothetical protein